MPEVALLDPDGDVVRYLSASGAGRRHPGWACYHTEMWTVDVEGVEIGVVGLAVGAPFAVLVAEQLFVSGAEILVSVTSAGQVAPLGSLPRLVLIDRALRDEGTSLHYLPPSTWSELGRSVSDKLAGSFHGMAEPVTVGSSWTTDAPYRETVPAIEAAQATIWLKLRGVEHVVVADVIPERLQTALACDLRPDMPRSACPATAIRRGSTRSKAEIIRCFKRFLAREIWAHMRPVREQPAGAPAAA